MPPIKFQFSSVKGMISPAGAGVSAIALDTEKACRAPTRPKASVIRKSEDFMVGLPTGKNVATFRHL